MANPILKVSVTCSEQCQHSDHDHHNNQSSQSITLAYTLLLLIAIMAFGTMLHIITFGTLLRTIRAGVIIHPFAFLTVTSITMSHERVTTFGTG